MSSYFQTLIRRNHPLIPSALDDVSSLTPLTSAPPPETVHDPFADSDATVIPDKPAETQDSLQNTQPPVPPPLLWNAPMPEPVQSLPEDTAAPLPLPPETEAPDLPLPELQHPENLPPPVLNISPPDLPAQDHLPDNSTLPEFQPPEPEHDHEIPIIEREIIIMHQEHSPEPDTSEAPEPAPGMESLPDLTAIMQTLDRLLEPEQTPEPPPPLPVSDFHPEPEPLPAQSAPQLTIGEIHIEVLPEHDARTTAQPGSTTRPVRRLTTPRSLPGKRLYGLRQL
jgi:hypothetical protein